MKRFFKIYFQILGMALGVIVLIAAVLSSTIATADAVSKHYGDLAGAFAGFIVIVLWLSGFVAFFESR